MKNWVAILSIAALVAAPTVANADGDYYEVTVTNLTRGRDLLTGIMAFGQERGEIRADRDASELARIFQQTMFGTMVMWTLHPPSHLGDWLDSTFDVFWSGIAARAAQLPVPGKEKKS